MDPPALVLHLGLPKTSSTWLQKSVFPALTTVSYAGHMSWRWYGSARHATRLDKLFWQDPAIWQQDGAGVLEAMTRDTTAGPGSTLLLSEEKIVLSRLFGDKAPGSGDQPARLGRHMEGLRAAARERGFARVAVLIVFRRQDQWLASRYAQSSGTIPGACQTHFETETRRIIHDDYTSRGIHLDYTRLRGILVEALGRENVHMLPYEKLVAAPEAFMQDLHHILGEPAGTQEPANRKSSNNVRRTASGTWSLRPNRATVKLPAWGRRLAGGRRRLALSGNRNAQAIELPAWLSDAIRTVYEPVNRDLAAILGEDLLQYGYYPGGAD